MNKFRRKRIANVILELNKIKNDVQNETDIDIVVRLEDLIDVLTEALDEEETYRDNMPENLQSGERYEKAENACDSLDSAVSSLEFIEEDDSVEYINQTITDAICELEKAIE